MFRPFGIVLSVDWSPVQGGFPAPADGWMAHCEETDTDPT